MWEKFSLGLLEFFLKGFALLPLPVLYVFSDFLYFCVFYLVRYRYKVVHSNLISCFPEKSPGEIKKIEKLFYRHFCDVIVETLKMLHISDEETKKRVKFVNPEYIENLRIGNNDPILLYMGHYGNWEYTTSLSLWVREGLQGFHVYHPLTNKLMDKFFTRLRSRYNTEGIPMAHIYRRLIQTVKSGQQAVVGLISDQRPRYKFSTEWMTFLNRQTPLITGGEVMGKRLNAHFVYVKVSCPSRGYYELTFSDIRPSADEDFAITKEFMRMLERDIMEAPQYWLWSHKRWKYAYLKENAQQ